jgi:hypothetical protein
MVKKDYEKTKKFLYTDGTAIEDGNYFIIDFKERLLNDSDDLFFEKDNQVISNSLYGLYFNTENIGTSPYIDLNTYNKSKNGLFYQDIEFLLFKYLGDNNAIELVTNQMFSIQFSEDLEKSTYESIFNDYKLSKDNNKKSRTDFSLVIAGSEINFIKPTEQLKLEYWNNIFGNEKKKQVLQDTFKEYTDNFDKNYERIIRNEIYTIATVENAMYDLDRRTNQKVKQKTLQ